MTNSRVHIIAVLNVTPDSYVPESRVQTRADIVELAKKCVQQGAHIVEVGGESTGPGSADVPVEEELKRVIPAVEAIRQALPGVTIAVDTWKAEVARQAVGAGAAMINDVSAGRFDPQMLPVIASCACRYVMMYAKDASPRTGREMRQYDDVIGYIHNFLAQRIVAAVSAGIDRQNLIVDPGLGHFVSSDPRYSFEILANLHRFTDLGPVFVSPSRKSFLAGKDNLPVKDRLPGTLAATTVAVLHGAEYVRTHDVAETVRVVEVAVGSREWAEANRWSGEQGGK